MARTATAGGIIFAAAMKMDRLQKDSQYQIIVGIIAEAIQATQVEVGT